MIQEIKKKVSENVENLSKETRKLSVKLVSFVISCWLMIGTVAIGLVVQVQVAKSVMKSEWVKEAKASEIAKPVRRTAPSGPMGNSYSNIRNYGSTPVVRRSSQPTLKGDLQSTRDTVSELRGLANGLRALATR